MEAGHVVSGYWSQNNKPVDMIALCGLRAHRIQLTCIGLSRAQCRLLAYQRLVRL